MSGMLRPRREALQDNRKPHTGVKPQNRAEEIRRRRASRSERRHTSPKLAVSMFGRRRFSADSTMPPVLVRGDLSAMPVQRRSHRTPRRRYDVALNVPGAEVRLPALPTVRLSWRIVSGILVIASLVLLFNFWNSPAFKVKSVDVNGLKRLTSKDINTVINVSGDSIFSVNSQRIIKDLHRAFPEFKSISVEVGLPAKISISIAERQPIISWQNNDSEKWVDAEGVAFPPRGEAGSLVKIEAKDTPNVRSQDVVTTTQFIDPQMVAAILKMAGQAPQGTAMLFDNVHGLGWKDPQGWQVYFGWDMKDMDIKLRVYQAMVNRLKGEGIQPALVSVEYVHAPYYRLEH